LQGGISFFYGKNEKKGRESLLFGGILLDFPQKI
jgi:hypothetical protein